MPDPLSLSHLPTASALTGIEVVPVVQGGTTKRTTVNALAVGASGTTDIVSASDYGFTPLSGGDENTPYDIHAANQSANDTAWSAFVASVGQGATIYFGPGHFQFSAPLVFSKPISIIGSGNGTDWSNAATVLWFATTGLDLGGNDAPMARIEGLNVTGMLGRSTVAGSDEGVIVGSHAVVLRQITVENFGSHGVHINTAPGLGSNANNSSVYNVRVHGCWGDGFHVNGFDSNVITFVECDATNNAGWGYTDASFQNTYINNHDAGSGLGHQQLSGSTTTIINPYSEGGTNLDFTTADHCTALIGSWGTPSIVNTGGSKTTNIILRNQYWNYTHLAGGAPVGSNTLFRNDDNGVYIGEGTIIKKFLASNLNVAFGTIAANTTTDFAVTVTGVTGAGVEEVTVNANFSPPAGVILTARATNTNQVTVRAANITASPIVVGTNAVRIGVWQH